MPFSVKRKRAFINWNLLKLQNPLRTNGLNSSLADEKRCALIYNNFPPSRSINMQWQRFMGNIKSSLSNKDFSIRIPGLKKKKLRRFRFCQQIYFRWWRRNFLPPTWLRYLGCQNRVEKYSSAPLEDYILFHPNTDAGAFAARASFEDVWLHGDASYYHHTWRLFIKIVWEYFDTCITWSLTLTFPRQPDFDTNIFRNSLYSVLINIISMVYGVWNFKYKLAFKTPISVKYLFQTTEFRYGGAHLEWRPFCFVFQIVCCIFKKIVWKDIYVLQSKNFDY